MKGWFIFNRVCANIVTRSSLRGVLTSNMLRSNAMKSKTRNPGRSRGFSLIELLAVMAVVSLMVALIMPSVSGLTNTAGRRGAVNTLMNTFEQARVAALESGRPVYVLFWRRTFPDADSIMVLREPEDTSSATWQYEQLTRWIKLPKGVLLHRPSQGASILSQNVADAAGIFDAAKIPGSASASTADLHVLAFNQSGAVTFPTSKNNRKLIVSEGVRDGGGMEALISQNKQSAGGFEIISLSAYTGRAQVDVSTVQ